MESMFNKLTSEYGSKNKTWNFSPPSSPLTKTPSCGDKGEDESSRTEVDKNMHQLMAEEEEEAEEERKLKEQVQGMTILMNFISSSKKCFLHSFYGSTLKSHFKTTVVITC